MEVPSPVFILTWSALKHGQGPRLRQGCPRRGVLLAVAVTVSERSLVTCHGKDG